MWPISERFADALSKDHFVVSKAEILHGGTEYVLADLTDMGVLVDGSVSVDRSAVQRSATVTLVDRDGTLAPKSARDLLAPAGNHIRLYRGIMFNDRLDNGEPDIEYVPIGTFRFTVTEVNDPQITLKCFDRSWIISGEKVPFIVPIPNGTNVWDVVRQLVQTAFPGCPMNLPITNENSNGMVIDAESDPWEFSQTLAANLGQRLFFDPMGVLQALPEPSEWDPPVWRYDDQDPSNLALPTPGRTWSGEGYNGVIVMAENTDLATPLWAAAYDNDPNSPTQWGSAYGKRNKFIRDETIASQWQCQARANKELLSELGFLESLTVSALVNPALESGDVVTVAYRGDDGIIPERTVILDGFEVPLRANGTQNLKTRARRLPL